MRENKEIILVGRETREAVEQAIARGGIEECQRLGLNIDEIRPAHPNEIVIFEHYEQDDGLGTIGRKREIKVDPYQEAKDWLDAMCIVCLPIWMEQLRTFGIKDSAYWQMMTEERNEKRRRVNPSLSSLNPY